MDDSDRTGPGPIEVPEELLPALRAAAEHELELAADNGAGDWNQAIRARILEAARIVEVFDVGCIGDVPLERLADVALGMLEPRAPRTMEEVAELVAIVGVSRRLIRLRDELRERLAGGESEA